VSLQKWSNSAIGCKAEAQAVFERFKEAIRAGSDASTSRASSPEEPSASLTFDKFADLYTDRYVRATGLASADTTEYRLAPIRRFFGSRPIASIQPADIEDFFAAMRQPARLRRTDGPLRVRTPATLNRFRSMLLHMFNWAVARRYLERSPMRHGGVAIFRPELEDNLRRRRVSVEEEERLLAESTEYLRPLIVCALDTGLRRGEMLALTWADVDARPGWIRVRGVTAKSGKTRFVPVSTSRLEAVLDYLRLDAAGDSKPVDAPVFSNEAGEPIQDFRYAWEATVLRAHGVRPAWRRDGSGYPPDCREALHRIDLHWHDLRHEYASRLVEKGVPLSQVRDLLGHASIVTTERYDNQRDEALFAAAKRLEAGQSFKFLSSPADQARQTARPRKPRKHAKPLDGLTVRSGVSDGDRTRNHRSHSRPKPKG
jgi:integrase